MSSTTLFQVRPATLRDAKAIAELHNTTLPESYKGIVAQDQLPTVS